MKNKILLLAILIAVLFIACGIKESKNSETNQGSHISNSSDLHITDSVSSADTEPEIHETDMYKDEWLESFELTDDMKLVAITIDDGPDASGTPAYLDVIEENDIRATFFVIGTNITSCGDMLERMNEAGCEIGNHSYNHDYLSKMSAEEIQKDIENTNNAIKWNLKEYPVKFVRAPYFSYNKTVYDSVGYPLIDASKQESGENYDKTLEVLRSVEDGDIVLLHSWNSSSLEALKTVIPELKEQGFIFVTVSELFTLQNVTPENGVVYRNVTR